MPVDIAVAFIVGFFIGGIVSFLVISLVVMAGRSDSDE